MKRNKVNTTESKREKSGGCKMIRVDDKYERAYEFLAASKWRKEYELDKSLLPTVKAQSVAFKDGALTQLMAVVADLRMWANHFRAMGKKELAKELEQFSFDWLEEASDYLKADGLHQRDGIDNRKP